jgi:TonB family protein
VLQSVLNWHFAKDAAGGTRQVSVTFELPKEGAPPANAAGGGASSYRPEGNITADQFMVENSDLYTSSTSVLKSIAVTGISDSAKANLLARLPVHEGDTLPAKISDVMDRVGEAVAKFDPHLHVGINIHNGIATVRISPDEPTSSGNSETPERLRVSGNVQALQLISHVEPVYPALAKQAQIQGTVELSGLIGKDGRVRDLQLLRGHPLLVQAALSAVKDWWVYKPTTINGEPVEVRTEISVNFTLAPSESAEMPKRIQVDGNAQAANLITQVKPNYPPEAKQAGIQGTVQLQAVLGKDGKVQDIKVLSGEPVLAAAALDAVKQWVYRPTLLNGEPVEVKTTIDVNFTLQ